MIIVRGTNHYPQDIERTAESVVPNLRKGCSAAFSVSHASGHTEAVVFIAEVIFLNKKNRLTIKLSVNNSHIH